MKLEEEILIVTSVILSTLGNLNLRTGTLQGKEEERRIIEDLNLSYVIYL